MTLLPMNYYKDQQCDLVTHEQLQKNNSVTLLPMNYYKNSSVTLLSMSYCKKQQCELVIHELLQKTAVRPCYP